MNARFVRSLIITCAGLSLAVWASAGEPYANLSPLISCHEIVAVEIVEAGARVCPAVDSTVCTTPVRMRISKVLADRGRLGINASELPVDLPQWTGDTTDRAAYLWTEHSISAGRRYTLASQATRDLWNAFNNGNPSPVPVPPTETEGSCVFSYSPSGSQHPISDAIWIKMYNVGPNSTNQYMQFVDGGWVYSPFSHYTDKKTGQTVSFDYVQDVCNAPQ